MADRVLLTAQQFVNKDYDAETQVPVVCKGYNDSGLIIPDNKVFDKLEEDLDTFIKTEDRKNSIIMTVSDESRDRDGDRIMLDGWVLRNFRKNPVVLYGHNHYGLPIGRGSRVWRENPGKAPNPKGKRLRMLKTFAVDQHEFAKTVFEMTKAGFINTASVGFSAIKFKMDEKQEGESDDVRRVGAIFQRQELLESSMVPIPSNPNALADAAKSINMEPMKRFLIKHLDEGRILPCLSREHYESAYKVLAPNKTIFVPKKGFEEKKMNEEELQQLIERAVEKALDKTVGDKVQEALKKVEKNPEKEEKSEEDSGHTGNTLLDDLLL